MSDCNHNCEGCNENCAERDPKSFLIEPNALSSFGKTIGIVSGKGGVGKSLVTSLFAISKNREGKSVGILDADVTGPSIPKCFGLKEVLESDGTYIIPAKSKNGIEIVSSNLLLENETDPIIWRGPVIASLVKQFYSDVNYGQLDYLFIDMPPGTGDVSLTVFQSIPMDGIIIVTTPQDLVKMIVEKAIHMANEMHINVLGIVENMSYAKCPKCGEKIEVFGKSKLDEIAKEYGLTILGRIPFDSEISSSCDKGDIESIKELYIEKGKI